MQGSVSLIQPFPLVTQPVRNESQSAFVIESLLSEQTLIVQAFD